MKVEIVKSDRGEKRFKAVFSKDNKKVKTTHFGSLGKSYIDHNDVKLKTNYLKRHKPRENWNDKFSAGSLSRYILWNKKTLKDSIRDYKKIFDLE